MEIVSASICTVPRPPVGTPYPVLFSFHHPAQPIRNPLWKRSNTTKGRGKLGKSNQSPTNRDDWALANHQGIIPSGLPSNPENRSPFKTRYLGGEKPGAPDLAKSLRKANRLLHPDLPRVCAEPQTGRPFPSPSATQSFLRNAGAARDHQPQAGS